MSFLASAITKTVDLPFDPSQHAVIRKLSGKHLRKARQAHLSQLFEEMQARGGAKVQKEVMDAFRDPDAQKKIADIQSDPLNGLDPYVLVGCGLMSWTVTPPVSPEVIDDLDEEALLFFANAIMQLTKPSLYDKAVAEEQRKND